MFFFETRCIYTRALNVVN